MFRKKYKVVLKVVVLAIVLGVLLNACSKRQTVTEEYNTISDLAYSEKCKIEPIIYIEEKTGFVPYIVLTNDYNGKTLLLRKEILPENRRVSDYSAYYEESEIDNYLMGEFFDNLPIQTRCLIQDSEIEILDERCLNQIDDSVITIVRKVFLLSFTELVYKKNGHVGVEGVPLLYFKDNKNRFATTNNGKFTVSWWLRSADSTYDSCVYAVGPEGEIGSTNACNMNGIRPAFCVDGKQEIYKEEGRYILK